MIKHLKKILSKFLSISVILTLSLFIFASCNNKEPLTNLTNESLNKENTSKEIKTDSPETPEYAFLKNNYSELDLTDNDDFSTFKLLDSSTKDKDIFLAGEMHGTSATHALKLKLLKYYKNTANISYFLVETSYSESVMLNEYLTTGNESTLEKLLQEKFIGTPAYSKEFYNFWKTLYDYNQTLSKEDRIKIIGVDCENRPMRNLYYMTQILPEKKAPKVILPIINELKSMYKDIAVDRASITNFTPRLKESIDTNRDLYKEYLGDNLIDFEMLNYSLITTYEYNEYDNELFSHRDEIMYKNFVKLYSIIPKGKFFGQFGGLHTSNTDGSFYSLLNTNDSPVKGKILSIYYLYNDCEVMNYNAHAGRYIPEKQGTDFFPNDLPADNILNPFIKSDITLFKLTGKDSPFSKDLIWFYRIFKPSDGVTTDSCQYVITIKNSKGCTPLKTGHYEV